MNTCLASDAVFQSYGRCCASERFFEDFYQCFIRRSDAVRTMFANTDMAEQRRLLRAGIMWLIMVSRGASTGKLQALGKTHGRNGYNISPALYDDWVQALLQTVALHDHQCGKQLEQQWRDVLMPAIDIIKAAY